MPLVNANAFGSVNWSLQKAVTTFASASESDQLTYNMPTLNFATWNQIYVTTLSISASGTTDIDLTSVTNFVNESFSFAHIISLTVVPTGANITIGPSPSDGLAWFWSAGYPFSALTVYAGGQFQWFDNPSNTGQVVDSSHKNIRVTNLSGSSTATVYLAIIGSTS